MMTKNSQTSKFFESYIGESTTPPQIGGVLNPTGNKLVFIPKLFSL
jgi:hypothetical protein